jgi:ADP-ribosylglycohydrolase
MMKTSGVEWMKGAILGDIVGSAYESRSRPAPKVGFPLFGARSRFTDDTVMTVAVMSALMRGIENLDESEARRLYGRTFHAFGNMFRHAGYGARFRTWLDGDGTEVVDSFGNGAIMRVSPVAWFFDDLDEVERQAERTTLATHEHEESRRAARAVATTIFLARRQAGQRILNDTGPAAITRDDLCRRVEQSYGYDLSGTAEDVARTHGFDVTCAGTIPLVFAVFRECTGVEDAVRRAVRLGGDTDTNACIAGALAEGWFGGVSADLWTPARCFLDPFLVVTVDQFLHAVGA